MRLQFGGLTRAGSPEIVNEVFPPSQRVLRTVQRLGGGHTHEGPHPSVQVWDLDGIVNAVEPLGNVIHRHCFHAVNMLRLHSLVHAINVGLSK